MKSDGIREATIWVFAGAAVILAFFATGAAQLLCALVAAFALLYQTDFLKLKAHLHGVESRFTELEENVTSETERLGSICKSIQDEIYSLQKELVSDRTTPASPPPGSLRYAGASLYCALGALVAVCVLAFVSYDQLSAMRASLAQQELHLAQQLQKIQSMKNDLAAVQSDVTTVRDEALALRTQLNAGLKLLINSTDRNSTDRNSTGRNEFLPEGARSRPADAVYDSAVYDGAVYNGAVYNADAAPSWIPRDETRHDGLHDDTAHNHTARDDTGRSRVFRFIGETRIGR